MASQLSALFTTLKGLKELSFERYKQRRHFATLPEASAFERARCSLDLVNGRHQLQPHILARCGAE
jgi:hypothetical protein